MLSAAAHKLTAVHVIFLMFSNKLYVNPAKKFIFHRTGKKSEKKKLKISHKNVFAKVFMKKNGGKKK